MQFLWVYWHNGAKIDELRWSMRSVLKNYQGKAEIIVVGDKPPWYDGPHIPVKRVKRGKYRAFRDSLNKLMIAAASPLVQPEFVWMMDDIYFNKPVTEEEIKTHYYQSTMTASKIEKIKPGNKWQRLKMQTFKRLQSKGLPMRDYATHLPQYVEKTKFKEMVRLFDPACTRRLMIWEVLYGNLYEHDAQPSGSVLYRTLKRKPYLVYAKSTRQFINNGNKAWNEALRGYLWETFPDKSQFETEEAAQPYTWYKTGKPEMTIDKKVVAVVPYRESPDREPGKRWVQQYLEHRCDEVFFADSGSATFNRSASINDAVKNASAKFDPENTILVIADADCTITGLRFNQAVNAAYVTGRLVIPHDTVCRMDQGQSTAVLKNDSPQKGPAGRWYRETRTKKCVSGILAIKLSSFIKVNGFDESFKGWGGEDNAFFLTCERILGEARRLDGPLFHFWHPKSSMALQPKNAKLYSQYRKGIKTNQNGFHKNEIRLEDYLRSRIPNRGKAYLIANNPLASIDGQEIGEEDIVVRFNDAKSGRSIFDGKVDMLFLNWNGRQNTPIADWVYITERPHLDVRFLPLSLTQNIHPDLKLASAGFCAAKILEAEGWEIELIGFTHEGTHWHDWDAEKSLIASSAARSGPSRHAVS